MFSRQYFSQSPFEDQLFRNMYIQCGNRVDANNSACSVLAPQDPNTLDFPAEYEWRNGDIFYRKI